MTFQISDALFMAKLSKLAYSNPEPYVGFPWEHEPLLILEAGETQVLVYRDDKTTIIVPRGTEPDKIKDWLTDLNFGLVDGPLGGQVHAGFYSALMDIWSQILDVIAYRPTKYLYFSGHSMGADISMLAAAKAVECGLDVTGNYNFGAPRPGNGVFAKNYNRAVPNTWRSVVNNDTFTRTPPRALGYSHCGRLCYFKETGEFVHEISAWNAFLDRVHGRIEDIGEWGTDGLKDHFADGYIEHYARLLEAPR